MTISKIASLNFSSGTFSSDVVSKTSKEIIFPEIETLVVGDDFCSRKSKDYKTEEQLREDFVNGRYKDGQTGKVGESNYIIKNNSCWIYKSSTIGNNEQRSDKNAINYDSLEKLQADFECGKYNDGQYGKVGNQMYIIKNSVCTVYTKK